MKTLRTLAFSLLLLIAFLAPEARAQANNKPPGKMTFQGFLTDSSGNPLGKDNPTNMTVFFRLYKNATGTGPTDKLWAEQQVVTIDRGHFSVLLGEGTPTGASGDPNNAGDLTPFFIGADASDRFLGIQVTGQSEIAPRIQFFPAPYSMLSQYANGLITPTGAPILNANSSGFVGISTATPERPLQVGESSTGPGFDAIIRLEARSASGASQRAWEIGSPGLSESTAGKFYSFVIDDVARGVDPEFIIRWDSGFVGIGKTNPASLLDVNGTATAINFNVNGGKYFGDGGGLNNLQAPNLVGAIHSDRLPGTINGDKYFTGNINLNYGRRIDLGIGSGRVDGNNGVIGYGTFTANTLELVGGGNGDSSTRRTIFHSQGGSQFLGSVGINRWPRCQLDVGSGTGINIGSYGYLNWYGASHIDGTQNGIYFSILADYRVGASEFNAFSDRRIKNVVGASDRKNDLATILKLKVTDYYPKDRADGTQLRKGFIAQEIEQIIPEAVTKTTNWVPTIYSMATFKIDNAKQKLSLTLTNNHDLKVGDMVRLYTDDGRVEAKVEKVPSSKEFVVGEWTKQIKEVFVFGKEADDFRTLNYDRIFTTGIGAIQELAGRLEEKSAQVSALEKKVADLEKMVTKLAAIQENKARAEAESTRSQGSEVKVAQAIK